MAGIQGATVGVMSPTSGVNSGGIGNIQPQVINPASNTNVPTTGTTGSLDIGSLLGSLIGTGANIYGSQNAAEAATKGNQAAITQQQQTLGNVNALYQPQASTGNAAFGSLGTTLGLNGKPADYSNFLNMPGYQFAVNQGTQAIQRQATAMGNAYTPNTAAVVGQYVTGTAMQDYNTYVQQLLSTAGYGAQANQGLANANLSTGANISQLMANIGQNQAGGYSSLGGTLGAFLGGQNGSGVMNNLTSLGRQAYNYFNGGGAGGTASDAQGIYSAINNGTAATSADAGVGAGYGMIGNTNLVDPSTFYSPDVSSYASDVLPDLGFNSAGAGGATAAGTESAGATSYGADLGAETATAGDASTGLTVSPGVAALPMAVMLGVAAHQNPTALSQSYWNNLNATLAAGPGSDKPNWGASNALQPIQQYTSYEGALSSLASAYQGQGQGNSTIPNSEWQTLAQYGITPQSIGNLVMPDMGTQYWQNLSASSGVPIYSTPGRQGL